MSGTTTGGRDGRQNRRRACETGGAVRALRAHDVIRQQRETPMALRDSLSGSFTDRIDELKSDIATLSDDLRRRAKAPLAGNGHGGSLAAGLGLGGLAPAVEELLHTVQQAGSGLARDARDRSGEAYRAVERTVEHNPMPAIAVAIGVGFLLGWLSRPSR
ncbi:MAG TPA: hypothetical protein VHD15_18310 [Hyphomicrobiales bacterium]|nr:hypothetical protein [Hyphomicrobiales bacterium]